jgi:hypothetical protein
MEIASLHKPKVLDERDFDDVISQKWSGVSETITNYIRRRFLTYMSDIESLCRRVIIISIFRRQLVELAESADIRIVRFKSAENSITVSISSPPRPVSQISMGRSARVPTRR